MGLSAYSVEQYGRINVSRIAKIREYCVFAKVTQLSSSDFMFSDGENTLPVKRCIVPISAIA